MEIYGVYLVNEDWFAGERHKVHELEDLYLTREGAEYACEMLQKEHKYVTFVVEPVIVKDL